MATKSTTIYIHSTPTTLNLENKVAIQVAKNTAPTKRRKYIDIRYHHKQILIERGDLTIQNVPCTLMLVDGNTKPLTTTSFKQCKTQLHITPPPLCFRVSQLKGELSDCSTPKRVAAILCQTLPQSGTSARENSI